MKKINQKDTLELHKLLIGLLKEKLNLRLQLSSGKLKKVHLIKCVKRNIARIKTIITYRKNIIK
ncbi:50S ribosomal protein L29 [Buchnera aphidicola (Cinara tujafilina)]|uniref:Large ribosomal subunit protein uL29 n=1 Tax=Buchnera aphidicola (Cinara tujafilina) TaxID=261317 RepID=F7WZP1_9GAMM|nr:50S ribosomal protein L29 [Buchnera aphidicola]AEH39909.1 50S ribosomal protein L29 [Buchnera aphidicola (Cinara tujafilina)]